MTNQTKILTTMRIKTILCMALLALRSFAATAASFSHGDFTFETTSENTVKVKGYFGAGGSVTIPDQVTNDGVTYAVTAIGNNAFNGNDLTSVAIPNSVTTIGLGAFSECSSLTSIAIPNSVTTIETGAFAWCSSLTSVTIGASVTTIGVMAFAYCRSLTSIAIPNSVTTIGKEAFYGCSSLTSIAIGASVTAIGSNAFTLCSSLTSVTIGASVTVIGNNAFANCSSLADVHVDWATPLSIPNDVFMNVNVATCTLHVPAGKEALYKAAAVWQNFLIPGAETLTVSPSTANIAASGGATSIAVTSNVSWSASSSASWATVSPSSGSGDGTVTVTASANTGAARTATITFSGGGITQTLTVTQEEEAQDIVVEPTPPTENEQGYLILRLGIPTDDSFSGTFLVILPSGMSLDRVNTVLLGSLADRHDLVIAQAAANAWSVAIRPKTSPRTLSATAYQDIVKIAYTVDETVAEGSYEIIIRDLEVTLDDETVISEDEIRVEVTVVPSGNESVEATPAVWYYGGRLSVRPHAVERGGDGLFVERRRGLPGSEGCRPGDLPAERPAPRHLHRPGRQRLDGESDERLAIFVPTKGPPLLAKGISRPATTCRPGDFIWGDCPDERFQSASYVERRLKKIPGRFRQAPLFHKNP
jgi:hypothetical protein